MTVKMPLPLNSVRSWLDRLLSKLRSSFSIALCRQRDWNSHSVQCRFRTKSGGVGLESSAAIFSMCFLHPAGQHRGLHLRCGAVVAADNSADVDLAAHRFR